MRRNAAAGCPRGGSLYTERFMDVTLMLGSRCSFMGITIGADLPLCASPGASGRAYMNERHHDSDTIVSRYCDLCGVQGRCDMGMEWDISSAVHPCTMSSSFHFGIQDGTGGWALYSAVYPRLDTRLSNMLLYSLGLNFLCTSLCLL